MYITFNVMLPHDDFIPLLTSVVHHEVNLSALAVGDQRKHQNTVNLAYAPLSNME